MAKQKVKVVAILDCEIEEGSSLFAQMKAAFDGSNPGVKLSQAIGQTQQDIDDAVVSDWDRNRLYLAIATIWVRTDEKGSLQVCKAAN